MHLHNLSCFWLQTRSDSSPEVATKYQLVLVAAGQARINFDNSTVDVFVVASDFPHGVVEFGQPFQILADEGVGVAQVPVLRNFGSIGTLMANFTVIPDTATAGVDYVIQDFSECGVVCLLSCPVMCLQCVYDIQHSKCNVRL